MHKNDIKIAQCNKANLHTNPSIMTFNPEFHDRKNAYKVFRLSECKCKCIIGQTSRGNDYIVNNARDLSDHSDPFWMHPHGPGPHIIIDKCNDVNCALTKQIVLDFVKSKCSAKKSDVDKPFMCAFAHDVTTSNVPGLVTIKHACTTDEML